MKSFSLFTTRSLRRSQRCAYLAIHSPINASRPLVHLNTVRPFASWVGHAPLRDQSQNYLSAFQNPLQSLFEPKRIAVVGATDRSRSVGRTLFQNLIYGAEKKAFELCAVNPTKSNILGMPSYPSLLEVPSPVDLAVIVTPAKTVGNIMREAAQMQVKTALVISAGFKEIGDVGLHAEEELVAIARASGIRMIGPNCLGVMNPLYGMNATFTADMALPGNIAFISQSGAMCSAVLDWSLSENIGFSSFVSIGSMADINWGDLIEYLGNDVNTSSILMYMETIGNAEAFLSAAKEVARSKPIIVIKAGKSEEAARAAASHTGSLAGSYDAFEAAMKRVGILTVDTISELFNCALVLGKQPHPQGPNVILITNAGGPGVLATDALALNGGKVSPLEASTIARLDAELPAAWSHSNPVDVLGDASPQRYAAALREATKDKKADAVLVILSPQDVTEPTETAKELQNMQHLNPDKVIMASWMGGKKVAEGKAILNRGGIPTFDYPDEAAKIFSMIWQRARSLEMMYQIPELEILQYPRKQVRAEAIEFLRGKRSEASVILSETESKKVLELYGLPIVKSLVSKTEAEAIEAAEQVGYPVVLKIHSKVITHKKDVGGVQLDLRNAAEVEAAFALIRDNVKRLYGLEYFEGVSVQPMINREDGIELILGSYTDSQLGPLILFGSGGTFVEIFRDKSLAIPPLNTTLAKQLMGETKIYKALVGGKGKRFEGVNIDALAQTIERFSQMVVDLHDYVEECDINPLFVCNDKLLCLDARISIPPVDKPSTRTAVRPYPIDYVWVTTLKNGETVTLRPLHANDEHLLRQFHEKLSRESIRQRYLTDVSLEERVARQYLIAVCNAAYNKMIPLGVFNNSGEILGLSRLTRVPNKMESAELKMVIRDDHQSMGIGSLLLDKIVSVAKGENLKSVYAVVLEENSGMLKMLKRQHFSFSHNPMNRAMVEAHLKIE